MKRKFKLLVCILIVSFENLALAQDAVIFPMVASIGGTGPVKVIILGGEKELQVGQVLPFGAVIKTGPKNMVTLAYPDKSLVAVDADTQFEINDPNGEVQVNTLKTGQVRGSITTASKLKNALNAPSKHKFMIRSKAAVMGVRGTEFVMGVDPTGFATQIHTLEGVVDVGASESSLVAGQSVAVESGKFIEATEAGLSPVSPFNKEDFLKNVTTDTPGKNPGVAFSNLQGQTSVVQSVPPVGFLKSESNKKPDERVVPPEEQKQQPLAQNEDKPEREKKPQEESRKIKFLKFQAAVFGLFERVVDPTANLSGPPASSNLPTESTRDILRIKALNVSWNPEVPIPFTNFISAKGHVGFIFGEGGSLNSTLWIKELSLFAVLSFFNKLYVEGGWGSVFDTSYTMLARVYTLGGGFVMGSGKGLDRIFVNISNFSKSEPYMMVKVGVGLSF